MMVMSPERFHVLFGVNLEIRNHHHAFLSADVGVQDHVVQLLVLVECVDPLDHLGTQNLVHVQLLLLFGNEVPDVPERIVAEDRSVELVDRLPESDLFLVIVNIDGLDTWSEELLVDALDVLLGACCLSFGDVSDDFVPKEGLLQLRLLCHVKEESAHFVELLVDSVQKPVYFAIINNSLALLRSDFVFLREDLMHAIVQLV